MPPKRQGPANTESVDNYLKAILALSGPEDGRVSSSSLGGWPGCQGKQTNHKTWVPQVPLAVALGDLGKHEPQPSVFTISHPTGSCWVPRPSSAWAGGA